VEEIWFNYLTNALKYGGNPPVIRIGSATEGNGIKFWITDNGAGLSEAQQQELFKSFTRLENPKIQGHGLGLSIVKRIVEKLNGRVGVKSAPGQGSTFSFTLPAYMGGIALPPEFNGG
jgi:signal transduction histidine kinase